MVSFALALRMTYLEKNFEDRMQDIFCLLLQYIFGGQIVHRDLVKPPKQCSSDNLEEQEIPLELVNLWNELFWVCH